MADQKLLRMKLNMSTENQPTQGGYRLSSSKEGYEKQCNKWRTMFSKLHYLKRLVNSNINKFSQEPDKEIHSLPSADPSVYVVLPFKDQRSANRVRSDIYSLGAMFNVKPILQAKKLWVSRKTSPRSLKLNALCTYFNVICAMQIMSGTLPDTYINA